MTNKNAYAQSGVDVEAGYEVVERIKKHVARTERAGVMGALGGFGGIAGVVSGLSSVVATAGDQGQAHDQSQDQRKKFFHYGSSCKNVDFFSPRQGGLPPVFRGWLYFNSPCMKKR